MSGSSSAVERFLAKEEVAGSNPVFRSMKLARDYFFARDEVFRHKICGGVAKWLRRGSAKSLFSGSIPLVAFFVF